MKHKQYESWILDDAILTTSQKNELRGHLSACKECRQLNESWQRSKQLLTQSTMKTPADGFAERWQLTYHKKSQQEKVHRYRISLLSLVAMAFLGSLTYIIASGTFLQMIANIFTNVFQLGVGIAHGLSNVRIFLSGLPVFVLITVGFLLFGISNAFIMSALFTLWNLKNRKLKTNEISVD